MVGMECSLSIGNTRLQSEAESSSRVQKMSEQGTRKTMGHLLCAYSALAREQFMHLRTAPYERPIIGEARETFETRIKRCHSEG